MPDDRHARSVMDSKTAQAGELLLQRSVWFASKIICAGAVMALVFAASAPAASAADNSNNLGKMAFETDCVACHGKDGAGTPTGKALMAPDLRSEAVQKLTDAQIEEQIENGKNNMPPFKDTLSKTQIRALVAYVRSFGNKKAK
jgi:mono/diheme cytochrome c family protein